MAEAERTMPARLIELDEARPAGLGPRLPVSVWVAFVVLGLMMLLAFLGPLLVADPGEQSLMAALLPPTFAGDEVYLLGADHLGRSQLARVVHGLQTTILVSFAAMAIGGTIGTAVGMLSGFVRGRVDDVVMRLVDIQMSVPGILLVLTLAAVLKPSVATTIAVLSLSAWVFYARIARAQVLSLREHDMIMAVRAVGCSNTRILLRHILPNIAGPLLVISTLELGHLMIVEAALGYLGFGVPPPTPTLGAMISSGQRYLTAGGWWLVVVPGTAIALVIVSVNIIGDWLRDWLDPKGQRAE